MNATGGRTLTRRIQYVSGLFNPKRNRCLAMTYAAQMPMISENSSETPVVCRLLAMARPKSLESNRRTKCSAVNDYVIREILQLISSAGRTDMARSQ